MTARVVKPCARPVAIAIGSPATTAEVERGLSRLAALLETRSDAYSSVV